MSRLSSFLRARFPGLHEFRADQAARFSIRNQVDPRPVKTPVIVSLTTIPERLGVVHLVIDGLLRQTVKPNRMILWLDVRLSRKVPSALRRLEHRGLEIRPVEDIGPYTKIIYALKEFPASCIVTADDDVSYPEDWLAGLLEAHAREPHSITCYRAHRMQRDAAGRLLPYRQWDWLSPGHAAPSRWLFPTGVCGVLYPPGMLHSEAFNREVFQEICPTADDIWLKAMSLLNGVRCQKVRPFSTEWPLISGSQQKRLSVQNVENRRNDTQLRAVFEHYGLFARLAADFPLLSSSHVG